MPDGAKTLMQTGAGFQPRTGNSGDGDSPMPMPKPQPDEKRDDFVARCMKDAATQDITGANADETQARRVAACERIFDDAHKSAEVDEELYGLKVAGPVSIVDPDQGRVQADFCTFDDVDNDGEVTLSGAIDDGTKCTVSSYNHDTVMGQMLGTGIPDQPPVGKGVIRIVGNKAVADLQYFMETQRGREAFLTVKAMGPDARWSYAFRKTQVAKPTPEWEAKGARKLLVKLGPLLDGSMEVSPVKMPAGKGTGTLSVKSAQPTASVDGAEHPAEDFAYVPDREKPSTWKLPIFDASHVRNALARFDQAEIPEPEKAAVRQKVEDAARKFGIDLTDSKGAKVTASVDGHPHPAEDFAYAPDPEKPSTWKLPIFDADHVRNALARFDQTELPPAARAEARAKVEAAARKFGIDVPGKKSALDVQLEQRLPRVKRLIGLE